ncbi:RNA/RNP complex-1-interacting phosphatase-like [Anabas testudineus]|uniref:RNA/RNP complex-1-interacting phosphatase-like n=1 Tax=Anabas testudineus TaxID=64144 RepID=UPI000E462E90|nr:RNA/RNP complex-1-interacting phosphatase-like [Anabas testudineus]
MFKNLKLEEETENIREPGAAELPNQKKKKKKKNGVPDRWLDYRCTGLRIPGTRFIAFKVPLNPSLNCQVPESDSFGFWDLMDSLESQNQKLGLIIDLTFTTRYYKLTDVPQTWSYIKILTKGHQVPSDAAILSFKRATRQFLKENQDNNKLIGVHCTHGLNRTGYLVCRYLIDVDGLDPAVAVKLFNSCRGHDIERQNYLKDLQQGAKRSNEGIDEPEVKSTRGLAVDRPPRTGISTEDRPESDCKGDSGPSEGKHKDMRRPSGSDHREKTQSTGEKRPPGNRRRQKGDHKSRDRPPQSRLPPTLPLALYVWSPAAPKSDNKL